MTCRDGHNMHRRWRVLGMSEAFIRHNIVGSFVVLLAMLHWNRVGQQPGELQLSLRIARRCVSER